MGQARLNGAAWAAVASMVLGTGGAWATGPSRFASYESEAGCVAAHTFAPASCRVAFANARSEYEAKTPAFSSQALCTRAYASCMAWPPGAAGRATTFRPSWDGVDIVDTPTEHSVTPSPGSTGRAVRFAARSLDEEPVRLTIRGAAVPVPPTRSIRGAPPVGARPSAAPAVVQRGGGPERELPPSPVPPPGSGFKLEGGVLTYPAPARFQPKNLPKE
ncbi:DUF1190 domain-containing protein [Lichenibacterium minor]|uniref:DUF1190 domain-containing protein n=1 Tax=Lichenibacterium minor TaxID=2316528 RepID=UPI0013EDFFCD|nr:DUF1190 domain-containing protein [Lichenibacterium minor]